MSENKDITQYSEEKLDMGTITFANDVIAIIAGLAASEVQGVASMSGGIYDGVASALGRKNLTKGVKVEVGNEQVAVDLAMIFYYGVEIPAVAKTVQENVKKAVESMTGLEVVEVNIAVMGVRFEKEPAPVPVEAPAEEPEPAPAPRVR